MREQRFYWCKKHNISVALLAFLFASEFLSHYLFWGVLIVGTAYYIIEEQGKLFIRNPRSTVVLFSLCVVGMIGSLGSMFHNAYSGGTWVFLRDIIRISAVPLTFYFSGQLLKNKSRRVLYTTLYFFCSVYGIGSMLLAIPKYAMASGSLFAFSDNLVDQWVTAVGVFLAFFKSSEIKECYISPRFDRISKIGLIVLLAISFSRTAFLILICLSIPFIKKHFSTILKGSVILVLAAMVIWELFPEISHTFVTKIQNSLVEISSNESNWDDYAVVTNWRGYEVYCAKQEFSGYSLPQKVIGKGFGARVDVHGYARLVTSEAYLPYLHNGYYTTLIKMGIIGVSLNILYWIALYMDTKNKTEQYEKNISLGVISALAISMTIIHGIFWGGYHYFCIAFGGGFIIILLSLVFIVRCPTEIKWP